jgi:hypothetical protein
MTQDVETRLDGQTLVVRIPMHFRRRGGCKRIVAPDGSELVPATKPQPDGTLIKALARVHLGYRDLRGGEHWKVVRQQNPAPGVGLMFRPAE